MRLNKIIGAKQYQTSISMQDLLVWAIDKQKVMSWFDANQDSLGGLQSQMGMIVKTLELGASIDRFKSVTNQRMPEDAINVGKAVLELGVDERRLIVEHAISGDEPYKPLAKMAYVDARGNEINLKQGAVVSGVTRNRIRVDGVMKRIRDGEHCRVKPTYYGNDLRFFVEQYNLWSGAINLLTGQLSDLTHYLVDENLSPNYLS